MTTIAGNSFHAGQKFRVVDKVVICSVDTPLAGFGLVFGSYFLFNISYPAEVGAALEYVQRVLLGVNPSSGTKVARSRGKKIRSGVHDAVLSLIRELALFNDLDN